MPVLGIGPRLSLKKNRLPSMLLQSSLILEVTLATISKMVII